MKKILFAGNWKMNPVSADDARGLFKDYVSLAKRFGGKSGVKIFLAAFPPMPFLGLLADTKRPRNLFLGAQDVFFEKEGAFTGFVSPIQLLGLGASHVILGHSERRALGETSATIARKIKTALQAGLVPIVCVGEKERNHSGEFWHELRVQLEESFKGVPKQLVSKVIIAYEPVWAVGEKSKGAVSPKEIPETALFIRKILSHMYGGKIARALNIIYGGSVFPANAAEIISSGDISGFLVGRAGLKKKEIEGILNAIS